MRETDSPKSAAGAENPVPDGITFNANGLVPAIAQQFDTGEVLMMAWMNRDAVAETFRTGRVCYWSRSRRALWRKGETSGQEQTLKDFRWDCDGDQADSVVCGSSTITNCGRTTCPSARA